MSSAMNPGNMPQATNQSECGKNNDVKCNCGQRLETCISDAQIYVGGAGVSNAL